MVPRERGYESETSSEESGQGDVTSNRDGSTSQQLPERKYQEDDLLE